MNADSSATATSDPYVEATPPQGQGSFTQDVASVLQQFGVDRDQVSGTAAFVNDIWNTVDDPNASPQSYLNLGPRGAEAFTADGATRDGLKTEQTIATGGGVGKALEDNLPGFAGRALGLTPEQTNAAKAFYKTLAAGGLTDANGNVDLSKASQLSPLIGELGLVDPQTAKRLGGTIDSLGRGDILGAAANSAGLDGGDVKSLLDADSTLAVRGSAALDLFGVDVSPETLDKAASDLGEGNVGTSIDVLSAVGGDGVVGDVAKGAGFANGIYEATQDSSIEEEEWTNLALQGADVFGLSDEYKAAISAAPIIYNGFAEGSEGGASTDAALGATSDLARAVIPGAEGQVAGSVLDAFAGESVDYENLTEATLNTLGAGEYAEVGGDVANVVANGANVSSVAALSGSALDAAGAPKELGSVATAASGIAAGGITGYGAVAIGVGELIGGDAGKVIAKAGAYAAAAAGGPIGWTAGAFMLAVDLFGYKPPRKAEVPTQNGAFMGQGQDGAPAVFSATQNGGEDEMKIKVQQLNTEIEQKPEAMRALQPERGGQIAGGEVLLNGEWMYGQGDKNSDVRAGIDPALGFVVQKKGEGDEWQTTWRADVNPPPGSFAQMNAETGKLEIYAPAETVVPGKSPEEARSNAEFVKIWESNNGEAAPEGRENILYLAESGGFGQAQRNQPDNGEDVDWDVAKFTEQNDSGALGTGLGGSHSAADGGHMVSQEGTTDYETGGDYGYFDNADQLMQQINRGSLVDLAFKSEDGDDYVLYNQGNNHFDEMTKDDYEARVAEESKAE
jgi:hypothetical protein